MNYKTSRRYELHGELQAVQPSFTTSGVQFIPTASDVNVKVKLPSIIETGVQIRPSKRLFFDGDFRFYKYSSALRSLLVTERQSGNLLSTLRIDAKDVRLYIFGGVYALNEKTKLHFGTSYITNGFPASSINPGLVNTGGSELNFGVGKKISERWINFGVTGVFGNERVISSTQNQFFPGKYRSKGFIFVIGLRSKI
jgi:long-subunit fatty acid transport protein